jgi:hypothetical protein
MNSTDPLFNESNSKGTAVPVWLGQARRVTVGSDSKISRQSAHDGGKIVSPTHRPHLPGSKYFWYSFLLEAELPQGHRAAGRDMSMKNSNDTIENRTRDNQSENTTWNMS